jgi:iron complex outermembrane recepter protein
MKSFRHRRCIATAVACVVFGSAPASADSSATTIGSSQAPSTAAAQAASNPSTSDNTEGMNEIVVTAQRRSERLSDVPVSITAISSEQLSQADVETLMDISKLTPALRFDYVGPNVQPSIRGIGTSFATSGGLGNVGIYVDGFYAPNPESTDFQLLDVQSIQVLKGPQGTLFGRNTTGGAILVTTAQPSTTTSATAEAAYGSYHTQRYQGYLTTGLTDRIAVDIEGMYRKSDGFVRNIITDNQDAGGYETSTVRAGIKVQVDDDAYLLFRYTHNLNDDPTGVLGNSFVVNGVPLTAALHPAVEALFGVPTVATQPNQVANGYPVSFHALGNIFQLTGADNLGFATLTSYTQYRDEKSTYHSDLDYSSSPLFDLEVPNEERTITQEFLLASNPGSRLQWTTGAFYFNYIDGYPSTSFGSFGAPLAVGASSSSTTSSVAVFADATYEMIPDLFLTVGARYSHDMVSDAYFSVPGATGALTRVNVSSIDGNKVTPRAVVRYKPTETSSLYMSFTHGYKPGLLNVGGSNLQDLDIEPESISAYEIGYKYGTKALSFDAASFAYDYKNLQISSYNGTQSILTNAATARIYGVEGDLRYSPLDGLNLNLAAAYTDAKYRDFASAAFYDLSSPFLYNIGFRPGGASGQQMQLAPKVTGSVGASYAMAVARNHLTFSGNLYYTSGFTFDAAGQFPQKAYETLGLRLEWTDPSDKLTLALYGDNVTNSHYLVQVLPSTFGIGGTWAYPATVGGSVRYKFK